MHANKQAKGAKFLHRQHGEASSAVPEQLTVTFDTFAYRAAYLAGAKDVVTPKTAYWQMYYTISNKTQRAVTANEAATVAVLEKIVHRGQKTRLSAQLEQAIQSYVEDAQLDEMIRYVHQVQCVLVELLAMQELDTVYELAIDSMPQPIAQALVDDVAALEQAIARLYNSEPVFAKLVLSDKAKLTISNMRIGEGIATILLTTTPPTTSRKLRTMTEAIAITPDEGALSYLLYYIFQYTAWQPQQLEALVRILQRQHMLIVQPAATGKSLLYELAALVTPYAAIIVQPVASMAHNRFYFLAQHGIDRVCALVAETFDRGLVLESFLQGQFMCCYVAPENTQDALFREKLSSYVAQQPLALIGLDEAHCMSEWGHDFKVAYAHAVQFYCHLTAVEAIPLVACTSTANFSTRRDMQRVLQLHDDDCMEATSLFHRHVPIHVLPCATDEKVEALQQVMLHRLPAYFNESPAQFYAKETATHAGFIYCALAAEKKWRNGLYNPFGTRYVQNMMNEWLPQQQCGVYNTQMHASKRNRYLQKFQQRELMTLSTTRALSIGYTQANVDWTVHYGMPFSMEAYYQELMRAGQQGQQAINIVLLSDDAPIQNAQLFDAQQTPLHTLQAFSSELKGSKLGEGDDLSRTLAHYVAAFPGIEQELADVKKVVQQLNTSTLLPFQPQTKAMLERVLYRLMTLRYVEDYVIDYATSTIAVELAPFAPAVIEMAYYECVGQEDIFAQQSVFAVTTAHLHDEPVSFLLAATELLLRDYVYARIETSRRKATGELLTLLTSAAALDDTQSTQHIYEVIEAYFSAPQCITERIIACGTELPALQQLVTELATSKQQSVLQELQRNSAEQPEQWGIRYVLLQLQPLSNETFSLLQQVLYEGQQRMTNEQLYTNVVMPLAEKLETAAHCTLLLQIVQHYLGDSFTEQLVQQSTKKTMHAAFTTQRLVQLSNKVREVLASCN